MTNADLRIGQEVKANRDFSGVPQGTVGEIVTAGNSWPDTDSVLLSHGFIFLPLNHLEIKHSPHNG